MNKTIKIIKNQISIFEPRTFYITKYRPITLQNIDLSAELLCKSVNQLTNMYKLYIN